MRFVKVKICFKILPGAIISTGFFMPKLQIILYGLAEVKSSLNSALYKKNANERHGPVPIKKLTCL